MKAAEAILEATADEDKARIADADRQGRDLIEKLAAVETERGQLGLRLEQASRETETAREENVDRATKEQVRLRATSQLCVLFFSFCG